MAYSVKRLIMSWNAGTLFLAREVPYLFWSDIWLFACMYMYGAFAVFDVFLIYENIIITIFQINMFYTKEIYV
jgi:hypothetical protein